MPARPPRAPARPRRGVHDGSIEKRSRHPRIQLAIAPRATAKEVPGGGGRPETRLDPRWLSPRERCTRARAHARPTGDGNGQDDPEPAAPGDDHDPANAAGRCPRSAYTPGPSG